MQLKQYDYDRQLAEEGKRVELGDESYIVVARWGNNKFNKLAAELAKPYGKMVSRIDPADQAEIMMEVITQTIVLDWGGIMDGDEEVKYSAKNVRATFEKYPAFMNEVIEMAKEDAVFRREAMEEGLGNSETSSETSSESAGETEQH